MFLHERAARCLPTVITDSDGCTDECLGTGIGICRLLQHVFGGMESMGIAIGYVTVLALSIDLWIGYGRNIIAGLGVISLLYMSIQEENRRFLGSNR